METLIWMMQNINSINDKNKKMKKNKKHIYIFLWEAWRFRRYMSVSPIKKPIARLTDGAKRWNNFRAFQFLAQCLIFTKRSFARYTISTNFNWLLSLRLSKKHAILGRALWYLPHVKSIVISYQRTRYRYLLFFSCSQIYICFF